MRQILAAASRPFLEFFKWEASGGVLLLLAAIVAVALANSPLAADYEHVLHYPLAVGFGEHVLSLGLLHWVNDGLMAIFFFVVGLEIKREFLYGELRTRSAMILPVCAAIGGMVVPAILYVAVNIGASTLGGWGIPMATDIAFALGIVRLAARNAPLGLVVFLTALAIVDDLGAIIVVALAYSSGIVWTALVLGLLALTAAFLLNRFGMRFLPAYLLLGILAWLAFYAAGIHPTIAGVILGFSIPAAEDAAQSMLHRLEHRLEPWSSYLIMPVFALFNAGVAVAVDADALVSPVLWGIILGLCLGKPIGICLTVCILHKLFGINIPGDAQPLELLGVGMLAGIGFTMSIFIASLAFSDAMTLNLAKFAILAAAILAAIGGTTIFAAIGDRK